MLFDFLFDLRGHTPDPVDEAFKFDVDADALNLFGLSLNLLPLPHNLIKIGTGCLNIVRIAANATYLLFKRVESDACLWLLRRSHTEQGLLQLISEASSSVSEGLGLGGLRERLGDHDYWGCIVKVRGSLGLWLTGLWVWRPDHPTLQLLLGRTCN